MEDGELSRLGAFFVSGSGWPVCCTEPKKKRTERNEQKKLIPSLTLLNYFFAGELVYRRDNCGLSSRTWHRDFLRVLARFGVVCVF